MAKIPTNTPAAEGIADPAGQPAEFYRVELSRPVQIGKVTLDAHPVRHKVKAAIYEKIPVDAIITSAPIIA